MRKILIDSSDHFDVQGSYVQVTGKYQGSFDVRISPKAALRIGFLAEPIVLPEIKSQDASARYLENDDILLIGLGGRVTDAAATDIRVRVASQIERHLGVHVSVMVVEESPGLFEVLRS